MKSTAGPPDWSYEPHPFQGRAGLLDTLPGWTSAWDSVVRGAVVGRACDALSVRYDREFYLTDQVHNEAIVIPENIGAIRALTGFENAEASIEATNRSLSITTAFLPATTRPVPHVVEGEHPGLAAVRVAHADSSR